MVEKEEENCNWSEISVDQTGLLLLHVPHACLTL
jgi:hypothetical protein